MEKYHLSCSLRTIKTDTIYVPIPINGKILYDIIPGEWKKFWTICNWDTILKMFPHTEDGKIQCEKEMWEMYHEKEMWEMYHKKEEFINGKRKKSKTGKN